MRESGNGRDAVFPWSDPPAAPRFSVGDVVYSGECRGTVVSVDATAGLISVEWSDSRDGGAIVYPMEADYLRKAMPWEK